MLRAKVLIINILLLGSGICFAQYSDRQLYYAYLNRDMVPWAEYIASVDTAQAGIAERLRLLNYQYGYAAYAVSAKQPDARLVLDRFEANLNSLHGNMPEAEYLAYRAGANSYELSLNRWLFGKYSKDIYRDVKRAMTLDPDNPLVQTMKGNVEFYSPVGNKKEALRCFLTADSLYRAQGASPYLWNVRAVQATIVQCIEKTRSREEAISMCYDLLRQEPAFSFIRDVYLHTLLAK